MEVDDRESSLENDRRDARSSWEDVIAHAARVRIPNLDDPNDSHYAFSATEQRPGDSRKVNPQETVSSKGNPTNRDHEEVGCPRSPTNDSHSRRKKRQRTPSPANKEGSSKSSHRYSKERRYHEYSPHHEKSHHRHSKQYRVRSRSPPSFKYRSRSSSSDRAGPSRSISRRNRPHSQSRSSSPSNSDSSASCVRRSRSHDMHEPLPASWFKKIPSEPIDSSWIEETHGHGRRRKQVLPNGKEVTHRTKIEEARLRSAKFDIIEAKGHWFGRLHHLHFNPYTRDNSIIKNRKLKTFSRPFSQPGRGTNSIQNAIGLKDDRDYFNEVRSICRAHCVKFSITGPGSPRNWQNVSAGKRADLQAAMLKDFPFLVHFRDEDGDSWAVKMLAQSYLGGNKSYQRVLSGKSAQKSNRRHVDSPSNNDNVLDTQGADGQHSDQEDDNPDAQNDAPANISTGKSGGSTTNDARQSAQGARQNKVNATAAADRRKAAKRVEQEREREQRREELEQEAKKLPATGAKKTKKNGSNAKTTVTTGKGKARNEGLRAQPATSRRDPLKESPAGPSNSQGNQAGPSQVTTRSAKLPKAKRVPDSTN